MLLNSLNCALSKQPSLESNTNDKLPGATQTIELNLKNNV